MEAPSVSHSQAGMNGLLGLGASPQAPPMSPAAPASADLFGGLSVGGKHTCLLIFALDAMWTADSWDGLVASTLR